MKKLLAAVISFVVLGAALVYLRYRQDIAAHETRIAGGSTLANTPCGVIEYAQQGEGLPILALHGAGGGYDQGLLMADRIGDGFRVIAPSRFGYLNAPIPADASVRAQADAYACLLDHLGIERAAVVAFSAGGPSALQFALSYPERTLSLTMVSAISTLRPVRDDSVGPSAAMLSDFGYWAVMTFAPSLALDGLGSSPDSLAGFTAEERDRTLTALQTMLPMARREAGNNTDIREQNLPHIETLPIADITAPTLVIHAADDTLVPFAQGQHSADHIPGARLVAFERGGHLVMVTDAVWAEIRAFISQNR